MYLMYNFYTEMKLVLVLALVMLASSRFVRENHDYWLTAGRKPAETNVPFVDVAWNYCDYKCLYLESIETNYDFYVVNFKDVIYKPNFSACYAKPKSNTKATPQLWKEVIDNEWYENNCGGDDEDWLDHYDKVNEEGAGFGKLIAY